MKSRQFAYPTAQVKSIRPRQISEFPAHDTSVLSVQFSPDGQRLLTTSSNGSTKIWHRSGHLQQEVVQADHIIWQGQFSPTGDTFLTAAQDRTARLWDLQGICLGNLEDIETG